MSTRALVLLVLCCLLPFASGTSDPRTMVFFGKGQSHEQEDLACVTAPGGPTACVTQTDGGAVGDASDDCGNPSPNVLIGSTFSGLLAPGDVEDNYAMSVPQSGLPITISVVSHLTGDTVTTDALHVVDVWQPSGATKCAGYVGQARVGSPLVFSSATTGVFTLQTQALATSLLPDDDPHAQNCHVMCALTNLTGYSIAIGG